MSTTKSIKQILIVEDDRPMARALELKLNNSGFAARAVNDGEEALMELEKNKYDLMLLDLVMPKLDGFGVMSALRTKKIKIPIIVSSNLSQESDVVRAKSLGAVDYFIKSDTPISEVVTHVKKILGI